jgi:hypothetical protein
VEEVMKRIFAIMAVAAVVAAASAPASARHYRHHGWIGFRTSNAELRGNNGNSAWGRNSLTNPNNTAGPGSGGAGTR